MPDDKQPAGDAGSTILDQADAPVETDVLSTAATTTAATDTGGDTDDAAGSTTAADADKSGDGTGDKAVDKDAKPAKGAKPGGKTDAKTDAEAWRTSWADGLEAKEKDAAAKLLGRYASPIEAVRALMSGQAKIGEQAEVIKGLVKPLTDKSTPEEVAQWRAAHGIPEKASDLKMHRPEGRQMTEFDAAAESQAQGLMHKLNMSQGQADEVMRMYYGLQGEAQKALDAHRDAHGRQAIATMRKEWGPDFQATVGLIERMVGEEGLGDLMGARLADGSKLGNNPELLRLFGKLARERSDGGAFISESVATGVDLDAEIEQTMGLLTSGKPGDRKKYYEPGTQAKLKDLLALQEQRRANGQRRAG